MTITSVPQRKNLDNSQTGPHLYGQLESHKRTQLFPPPTITWLIVDIITLIVVPLPPTNLLQLSYLIFGDGFVAYIYVIYTHQFSLTPLLFLLCPISIHLSIRKLSLQAQWLPDVFM